MFLISLFPVLKRLIDDIFQSDGHYRMEMPYGRAEEDTLPDIEKKSPAVRKERLHLECRGEA